MKPTSLAASFVTSLLMTGAFAVSAQEQKTSQAEKPPAAAAQVEKKPAPAQRPGWPKGVPRFKPLSNAEKLKVAQGLKGFPNMTNASVTSYLTLYPGHLIDTRGSLTLGCPYWDMFAIALYEGSECLVDPDIPPGGNHVDLFFQADAGDNVYLIDFGVVVGPLGTPGADNGLRDFQITLLTCTPNTVPPCNQPLPAQATAAAGLNHLKEPIYIPAQQSGYLYEVRLQRQLPPNGGRWYFLAVDVSKYVNVP